MEACLFADIEQDFDQLVARVAPMYGIDPICSTSDWTVPLAAAFAPSAVPRVFSGRAGHLALIEHETARGPVLTGFDSVWGFATPLVGMDPHRLVDATAAAIGSLDFYALALSGIDARGPLFEPLKRLAPVGYRDSAHRCVADLAAGFDGWLAARSPRFRRSLRAAANRAGPRGITVEHVQPTTAPDVTAALARVLEVEAHSWKTDVDSGLVGSSLGFFTQSMSRRFARRGALRIAFAVRDGADLGYVIGAVHNGRYRGFQHSYDDRAADLSVGKLLQYHNVRRLCDDGVQTYDMGMHMPYKESYADRIESTITVIIRGTG